jgi:exopolysaccharide biosynthesis polyprenyl glycosylphosphotransferase
MIRLFHVYFPTRTLLLVVSELCLIVLAFLLVSVARSLDRVELWLSYDNGFLKIAAVSVVLSLCMYYYDLYDSIVLSNRRESLARLFQVLGTASVVLALVYFIYPETRLGRGTFMMGIGLTGLVLFSSRNLFFALNRSPRLAERVAILGDGSLTMSLVREIEKRPELGMRLLGQVSQSAWFANVPTDLRRLGAMTDLPDLITSERIDRLIVAIDDENTSNLPVAQLAQLKKRGLMISDGMSLYETTTGKVWLHSKAAKCLLSTAELWPSPALLMYKRGTSIVFSVLGLIICAPLMLLITIAIRLESEDPILFRQSRLGKDKRIFTLYKFRSMRSEDASKGNFRPTQVDDERCTRVGRWLRRIHLDELPQLYNILRGDMDFVGPRPFALEEEEALAKQIPYYGLRWTIKPGLTGWAQVQQGYCATVEDNTEKLAHDLFYLQNFSVGLDLLIVFRTTKILLWGRGAR